MSRYRFGYRVVGFDFFFGFGRSSIDWYVKGDEIFLLLDSEIEFDVFFFYSYFGILGNFGEEGL